MVGVEFPGHPRRAVEITASRCPRLHDVAARSVFDRMAHGGSVVSSGLSGESARDRREMPEWRQSLTGVTQSRGEVIDDLVRGSRLEVEIVSPPRAISGALDLVDEVEEPTEVPLVIPDDERLGAEADLLEHEDLAGLVQGSEVSDGEGGCKVRTGEWGCGPGGR